MTSKIVKIAIAVALISFGTGCEKVTAELNKKMEDVQKAAIEAAAYNISQDEKVLNAMNDYAEASNSMRYWQGRSYESVLAEYKKQNLGSTTKEIKKLDTVFDTSNLTRGIESLEKARKVTLGAPYDKLESAADALILALNPFAKSVEALRKYEKAKEYLEDKGEFAKSQDAQFITEAEAFLAAYNTFEAAHDEASQIHDREYIKQLKDQKRLREASMHEAAFAFKQILSLFESEEDFKDAAKQSKVDEYLELAKKSIETFSAENASAKEKTPDDGNNSNYERLESELSDTLGSAREFKASNWRTSKYETFMKDYNDYIDALNRTYWR